MSNLQLQNESEQRPKISALAVMASNLSVDPTKLLQTLKATVFRGATDDEILALVVISNTYGLNPILKEVYAFPAKGGGIVPVVSIDGWIRMMNDHPQFDGIDYEFEHTEDGKLISCTSIIYRKDRSHPTRVTEYLMECRRNTEPWKMERRMLRHKATIQGARVAFGFSGITDEDEAAATPGFAGAKDVTPKVARATPLDPFASLPETPAPAEETAPVVEAMVVESAPEDAEPTEAEMLANDIIEDVKASDAQSLASYIEQADKQLSGEPQQKVKKAIVARAKVLGVKWSKEKGGFEA
jgi:phage recombination protein Bet